MAKFLTEEEEDAVRNGGVAGGDGAAFADTGDDGTRSWQEALALQERQANDQREQAFQQKLDGYSRLEDAYNAQLEAIQQDRGMAFLAMIESIRKNGGAMSPALNQAMSEAFGMRVTGALAVNGGKNMGDIIVGTPKRDANGRVSNDVGMIISPEMQCKIFSRMKSQKAIPAWSTAYQIVKRKSGLTDDQLANRGFHDPTKIYVVGATTDGKATSKLFGITSKPKPRYGISATGFDGKGGRTNYVSNAGTGYQLESYDSGTRADDYAGRWKQIGSGPSDTFNGKDDKTQVRTYENSKTGEVVRVKDGEIPPWERHEARQNERKMIEDAKTDRLNKSLEARDKDRAAKDAKSQRDAEFREKEFQYGVSKDMAKEAKDFLSTLSEEDREAFSKKYPNMAKSILGMGKDDEPDNGGKKTVKSRKRATGKDGKTYERIVYSDGTETINEVM